MYPQSKQIPPGRQVLGTLTIDAVRCRQVANGEVEEFKSSVAQACGTLSGIPGGTRGMTLSRSTSGAEMRRELDDHVNRMASLFRDLTGKVTPPLPRGSPPSTYVFPSQSYRHL